MRGTPLSDIDPRFIFGGVVFGALVANYLTLDEVPNTRRGTVTMGGYIGAAAGVLLHRSLSNVSLGIYVFGPPIIGLTLPSVL